MRNTPSHPITSRSRPCQLTGIARIRQGRVAIDRCGANLSWGTAGMGYQSVPSCHLQSHKLQKLFVRYFHMCFIHLFWSKNTRYNTLTVQEVIYVIYAFECIWDMSLRCNIRKGQADKVGWRASQGKLNWVRPAGDGLRVPTSYWYMQNRCPVQTDSLRGKINQRITRRKTDQRDGCQPISQCSVLDIRASEHGYSSTKRPENGFDPSPNQNTSWCWNCLRAARNTPRQMMFKQISKNRDAPAKNCSSFYQK